MNTIVDRIKGTIYGQAIGDALGLGTEGMTDEDIAWKYPNGIRHYSDIFQDRHRKRWKIGDWTDDTDMMLCISNAVIKDKGVNLEIVDRDPNKFWEIDEYGEACEEDDYDEVYEEDDPIDIDEDMEGEYVELPEDKTED